MNLVIVDVIVAKTLAAMASVATNVSAKNATVDATVLNAIAVPIRSAAMLAPVQIAKLSNFRIAVQNFLATYHVCSRAFIPPIQPLPRH